MENKSKKKLWIALASLAVVVIAGLSVTVGVLAAQSATVTSTINVGYVSHQVSANVTAQYKLGSAEYVNFTGTGITNGTASFNGEEANAEKTMTAGNLTLDNSANRVVVFKYTFANTGSGSEVDFTAALTGEPSDTHSNVTITYSTDGETYAANTAKTFNVAAGATATFYIKVELVSAAVDVAYTGNFVWTLTNNHIA